MVTNLISSQLILNKNKKKVKLISSFFLDIEEIFMNDWRKIIFKNIF